MKDQDNKLSAPVKLNHILFYFFKVYLFTSREERERWGGADRERESQADSILTAQSPMQRLNS